MTRRDFAILFLILFLGVGITISQKLRQGIRPLDIEVDGLDVLEGPAYTFNEVRETDLGRGRLVEIDATRGDVEVVTGEGSGVRVEVRKRIRAESEERAERLAGSFPLEITPTDQGIAVRVTGRPGTERPGGLETSFTVKAPPESRLAITTTYGAVRVHGFRGSVIVRTSHEKVEVGDLAGSCEITTRFGSVSAEGVEGALSVKTEHGDVTASEIGGTVQIESAHGTVALTDVGGPVAVRSRHGDVTILRARKSVRVEAPHSSVDIEAVQAAVTAQVEADPIKVKEVSGPVDIRAEATSVELIDVQGPIRVEGRHTDVQVVRPRGDVVIDTTHQEISFAPPPGQGFRLYARSELGEIESELPELRIPDTAAGAFSAVVGDGRHTYRLSTKYSTIRLHPPE